MIENTMHGSLTRGTALPGSYVVEGVVGAGRVRTVYAARSAEGRRGAAHVLHASLVDDLGEWFTQAERRILGLSHPGLVTVLATGTIDGVPVLVTEFLEGETLRELLAGPAISVTEVSRVVTALGAVLDYLHGVKPPLIHRALMPENVFLADPDHRVKLLEVGTADRPRFASTRPAYNAPEELAGITDLSPRADVFALASLAYELLTGAMAFPGDAATALGAMRADTRPSVSARRRGLGPAIDAVLRRAWSLLPDARQPTAGDLARELAEALTADGDTAPSALPDDRTEPTTPVASDPATDDEPTSKLIALDATGTPVAPTILRTILTPLAPKPVPREREPRLPAAVVAAVSRASSNRPAAVTPPTASSTTARVRPSYRPPVDPSPTDDLTDRDIPTAHAPVHEPFTDTPTPRITDVTLPRPKPATPEPPPQPLPVTEPSVPAVVIPPSALVHPMHEPAVIVAPDDPPHAPPPTPPLAPRGHALPPDDPTEVFNIPVQPTRRPLEWTRRMTLAVILANGIAVAGIAHAVAWVAVHHTAPIVVQAPAPQCAPCPVCPPVLAPATPTLLAPIPAPTPAPVPAPVPVPVHPPVAAAPTPGIHRTLGPRPPARAGGSAIIRAVPSFVSARPTAH